MFVAIDDLEDERLDVFFRLTDVQLRSRLEPAKGIFIAESPKVIERALGAGCEPLSFLVPDHHVDRMRPFLSAYPDVVVFTAAAEVVESITGYELTRGVLCAMRRPQLPSVEELLADARVVAVLENITNHTNVGAAFRSAAALGVDALLVTPGCCDPLYRRAVRVSMGTVFQVPWTRIGTTYEDWPDQGMGRLKHLGFETVALALRDDALSLDDPRIAEMDRIALLFGTEGDGLGKATIDACDHVVKIPMAHDVDSLNVAAASAVVFWELCARGR